MLQQDLILPYIIRDSKMPSPPILFMLHGYGSDEQDLFGFTPHLPSEFAIYSIRAPKTLTFGEYYWYEVNFEDKDKYMNIEQAESSMQSIIEFIQLVKKKEKYKYSPVWIMGFSQGAILGIAISVMHPDLVTRVIALSGYFEKKLMPDEKRSDQYKNLKIFVSHGESDNVIPFAVARQTPNKLRELGISVESKSYPNIGHTVVDKNFQDLLNFIILDGVY